MLAQVKMYNVRLNTIEPLFLHNNHTIAWHRSINDKKEDKRDQEGMVVWVDIPPQ